MYDTFFQFVNIHLQFRLYIEIENFPVKEFRIKTLKMKTPNISEQDCNVLKVYLRRLTNLSTMISAVKGTIRDDEIRAGMDILYKKCMDGQKLCTDKLRLFYQNKNEVVANEKNG